MIKEIVIFSVGAAVGGFAVWSCCKGKYEQIAREEIDEVKAHYEKRQRDLECFKSAVEQNGYETVLKENGYIPEDDVHEETPYVIPPNEFGEFEDYGQISLSFYADGVLADENDEPVDIEMVGSKNLKYFGVYEDDSVYVRSDVRKCDYEILLCERNHADVLKTIPPLPVSDADGNIVIYEEETESEE